MTPILGLLPAGPVPNVQPRIRVFGEGLQGRSMEVRFDRVAPDPTLLGFLALDLSELPGSGAPCLQFMTPSATTFFVPIDAFGTGRMTVSVPVQVPSFLNTRLMMQGVLLYVGSGATRLTNGLRVTIGGAL